MNERDAFIRAVCAQPDDDVVRLAFADWCDENGEPERAEFVRVQVEMAKMPPMGPRRFDPRYMLPGPWEALRRRERELWESNARQWRLDELGWLRNTLWAVFIDPVPPDPPHPHFVFRRGFVASLVCTCAEFMEHARALFAAHPITDVTLTDKSSARTRHRRGGTSHRFCWWNEAQLSELRRLVSTLPGELMLNARRENFPTDEMASDWLSARCLAHGRKLAGLPAWEPKATTGATP